MSLNILFVASEVEGFAKTGGLADVAKSLPLALQRMGHNVIVMMPFYRTVKGAQQAEHLIDSHLPSSNNHPEIPFSIVKLPHKQLTVYGVANQHYFDRPGLYGEDDHAYHDNGERFTFFSVAVLEACEALDFRPDIIHCNDWHTALVPFLLKTRYQLHQRFSNTKSLLTIHNAAYQGINDKSQLNIVPEVASCLDQQVLVDYTHLNFLKAGVLYADKINAVSPNYASELLTPLGSHGMSLCFIDRINDFSGIVNGCDYEDWDPITDELLPHNYSLEDLTGKEACKRHLQQQLKLPENPDVPVFGMVCRLTEQKGFTLLLPMLERFLKHNVQLVIVGTGDPRTAGQLQAIELHHPKKFAFVNMYSNEMAHLVEAGSDFFLMPSLFEPCGLNQMYSLAYGCLPIVRGVGGLKDTVIDYDADPSHATGFIFYKPDADDLLLKLLRVTLLYLEAPSEIERIKRNAMKVRFDWQGSANKYTRLYQQMLSN